MEIPFVQKRKESWQRLNLLLAKAGGHRIRRLSKEELLELSVLYRRCASDLARARAERISPEIIDFLNDLVGRTYNLIYRTEKSRWRRVAAFIRHEGPNLVRRNKLAFFLSCLFLLAGGLFGYFGYMAGPESALHLLPPGFASDLIKRFEENTWFNSPFVNRPFISSAIMVNNIKVAINAFAGGMLLGILTLYVLFLNGFLLGHLSAAFMSKGYFLSFWAMILPHGVIELFAICLSATAGLLLARSLLFPGEYSRSDALKLNGKKAVKLLTVAAFLLVIAGLIEGFLSTISTEAIPEYIRLGFAALTGVFLMVYFTRR